MINLYFHTSDPAKRKMLNWFRDYFPFYIT